MADVRGFAWAMILLCATVPLAGAQITYTTIDVPGAVVTYVTGVNSAGDMVGYYAPVEPGPVHGFLLRNGTFTYFDYPGADSTFAMGINDSGLIVGWANATFTASGNSSSQIIASTIDNNEAGFDGTTFQVGFTYDGTTFKPIRVRRQNATSVWGVNNAGVLVGGDGTLGLGGGFELSGHQLRPVSPPGNFLVTFACGVNNLGEIVGFTSNGGARGFAFKHGQYEIVNIHNAKETEPLGINDDGIIVGFEITGGRGIRGFALKDKNHVSLMVPGSVATFAMGLNASGQVVGGYTSDNNLYHGFVSSSVSGLFQRGTGR